GHWRAEALAGDRFERVFLLFGDEQRDPARTAWREVSATDGLERSFFEQKDGRWVKVA
ncbi:MAG: DNA polymerase III subunit chi, partial [Citromicrobium sp.]|nr:DNA polymerase III subunit chi [Citromicrobium sp.]